MQDLPPDIQDIREQFQQFMADPDCPPEYKRIMKGLEHSMDLAAAGDIKGAVESTEPLEDAVLQLAGFDAKEQSDFKLLMKAYVNIARDDKTPPEALHMSDEPLRMAIEAMMSSAEDNLGVKIHTDSGKRALLLMGIMIGVELTELRHA